MNRRQLRATLDKEFNLNLKSEIGRKLSRRLTSKQPLRRFGLVGHPLGHSMSPYIHKHLMAEAGIHGEYRLYDVDPEGFDRTVHRMMTELDGFNITIPYKERILPKLEALHDDAAGFGAVNTVCGQHGYNTDIAGFRACAVPLSGRRVLLLGAGGVARVMLREALVQRAAAVGIYARNPAQVQALIDRFAPEFPDTLLFHEEVAGRPDVLSAGPQPASEGEAPGHRSSPLPYDVILNATPIGMWPHCGGIPTSRAVIAEAEYVFDSVYNPLATRLVLAARSMHVKAQSGLGMLLHQALEAQRIWNPGNDFSTVSMLSLEQKLKHRLLKQSPVKIVLTGFMGSGKTTIGRRLARSLGIPFTDIDLMIVEENAKPIAQIFREDGEVFFRRSEQQCLLKAMSLPKSMVVATGGGAVLNPDNVGIIRRNNGLILFLHVDIQTVFQRVGDDGSRPLLDGQSRQNIEQLYMQRLPLYHATADCTVEAHGDIPEIVADIRDALGF